MSINLPSSAQGMTEASGRRIFRWLLASVVLLLVAAIGFALMGKRSSIDPQDKALVATGNRIYGAHCGACHGANLEGQPNWRERLPNGRLPAPPHDASGHTWHHPDALLFGIVKEGLVPGKYAPPQYESDMPAFGRILSDKEIQSVLAYIKSTWTERELAYQRQMDQQTQGR
jgi:mono/diheme cytochrome c family protein